MNLSAGEISVLLKARDEMTAVLKQAGAEVESFGERAKKVASGMTALGAGMTAAITVPTVAAVKQIISAGVDFESAFAGVRKTVDATETEFADLRQGIRDMSKEMPASAVEIAAVAEAAGQLGIQTPNILEFTRVMINLGVATNMSATDAATSLARFMNIMGTAPSEVGKLGAAIVGLGNNFATTESEIVEMALRIAGAGNIIGLAESDVLALATSLSSVGIEAQAGGTAISRVMIEIANQVRSGGDNLEQFASIAGMTVGEFTRLFQEDAIQAIFAFISGLNEADAAGENLFGIMEELGLNEIRVRDALLRSASARDLLNDAISQSAQFYREETALTEEAEQRYGTLASQIQMARNQINDIAISLYDHFRPALIAILDEGNRAIRFVRELAEGFMNLPTPVQAAVLGFIAAAAAIGPLLVLLGGLVLLVSTVGAPVLAVAAALTTLGAVAAVVVVEWDRINALFPEVGEVAALVADAFVILGDVVLAVLPAIAVGVESVITLILGNLKLLLSGLLGTGKMVAEVAGGIKQTFADIESGNFSLENLRNNFSGAGDVFEETSQRLQDASTMMMGALDPILSPRKFMEGMDEWRDRLDGLAGGFGKAKPPVDAMTQAVYDMNNQVMESPGAFSAAAESMDGLTEGLLQWDAAQAAVNNNIRVAGESLSVWEGNLKNAQTAVDMLKDAQERQNGLTVEQQQQLDTLTWYVGRLESGIADDLNPAYIVAQVQAAEFMRVQDELKAALDAGTITQEQYNQAIIDAAIAADPAAKAAEELTLGQQALADTVGAVIDKLRDLMVELGLLPADKTTEFHTPGLDDAIGGVNNLKDAINTTPSYREITFSANTDAAIRAVYDLNAYIPSSPAKKGPFKKLPEWGWIYSNLPDEAERAARRASAITNAIITGGAADMGRIGELANSVDNRVAFGLSQQLWQTGLDLEAAILSGADQETRDKLQAELDAITALLAAWSERTGMTIEDMIEQAIGENASIERAEAMMDIWRDTFSNINDFLSGEVYDQAVQDLADLRRRYEVAAASGAGQAFLDELAAEIEEQEARVQQIGQAFGEAVAAGMLIPLGQLQAFDLIARDLDQFLSGDLLDDVNRRIDEARQRREIAVAMGLPQEIIDSIDREIHELEATANHIGMAMGEAWALGFSTAVDPMSDPKFWEKLLSDPNYLISGDALADASKRADEAKRIYDMAAAAGAPQDVLDRFHQDYVDAVSELEAIGTATGNAYANGFTNALEPITQDTLDQIAALGVQGADAVGLLDDALFAGQITAEQFAAAVGVDGLEAIQQLSKTVSGDLAEAILKGADTVDLLTNNMFILSAVIDMIKEQARDFNDGFQLNDINQNTVGGVGGGSSAYTNPAFQTGYNEVTGEYFDAGNLAGRTPSSRTTNVTMNVSGRTWSQETYTHMGNALSVTIIPTGNGRGF